MSTDRDRILEQALKHELRAAGTAPAGACLDAETLGAWTDGALAPAAMAAAEAHVASCARCQALIGTMARTTPSTSRTPSSFSLWKWWLAPIAAGVTAVTLWMVVPEQPNVAVAPAGRENAAKTAPDAQAIPPPTLPPAAAVDQVGKRDSFAAAPRDDRQQNKVTEQRKEVAPAPQREERAGLADAAIPAAPPAPVAAAPGTLAESVTVLPRAAPAEIGGLEKSARAAAVIEIATLDPSLGWRIAGDHLERSTDGGKTWNVMRQNSGDGITAGSAPSTSVAWFVGRAGRVLLTTNGGATFTDVSLAEPLDLASVAATDGRSAMVFSVVGRRFRTDDGGRVWRPY